MILVSLRPVCVVCPSLSLSPQSRPCLCIYMLHYHTTLPSFLTPACIPSDDALLHLQTCTYVPVHARAMQNEERRGQFEKGAGKLRCALYRVPPLVCPYIKLADVECSTVHCPKVVCFLCFHLWRVYVYKSLAII